MNKFRFALTLIMACVCSGCTSMFFFPSTELPVLPTDIGLNFEDITIQPAPELNAWWLPSHSPPIATIVFMHGNANNISNHLPSVAWLPAEGFNVLMFDYEGYGISQGSASADVAVDDCVRATLFAISKYPELPIIIYGQSMGASLAIAALHDPLIHSKVKLLIAESPFSSYQKIAREKLASLWLLYPFQWLSWILVSDSVSPDRYVENWTGPPVLMVHSRDDQIVPYHHSEILCSLIGPACKLWLVDGAQHIQIFNTLSNRNGLTSYVRRILNSGTF